MLAMHSVDVLSRQLHPSMWSPTSGDPSTANNSLASNDRESNDETPRRLTRPTADVFQNRMPDSAFPPTGFLDHDDLLLGPQRDSASISTISPPSSESDARTSIDGLSTSPQSANSSSDSRSYAHSSPPTSTGLDHHALVNFPSGRSRFASNNSSASSIPSGSEARYDSASKPGPSMSPLSPFVEPFNPNATSPQTTTSALPSASTASASTATASQANQYNLKSLPLEARTPSSTGSVSSSTTVHSLYGSGSPFSDANGFHAVPNEIGAPGSLTSAAFASFGAQLATLGERNTATRASQDVATGTGVEEISTIFVVGFPDDMHEREFQNMFVFAPGFEAATLKVPGAGPSNASTSSRDGKSSDLYHFSQGYEDDYSNPPSLSHALGQRDPKENNNQRKQTIGFAKFRTRQEALDARDVLSGRRVDAEKDCVLKAEMAKKNLHTKRGLANEATGTTGSAVGVGNTAGNASLPPSVLAFGHHNLAVAAALNPAVLANALAQSQTTGGNASGFRDKEVSGRESRAQQQQSAAFDAFHSVPASQISPTFTTFPRNTDVGSAVAAADPRYNAYTASGRSDSVSAPSPGPGYYRNAPQNNYNKSLLQQLDNDQFGNPSSAIGQTNDGYMRHSFYSSNTNEDPSYTGNVSSRMQNLNLNTSMAASARPTSPLMSGVMSPRGTNPADMNPPINTLYVGGLPAVLPSLTGPMSASHLEDSLRAVFSRSPGFKRLCFRQKSNGPMSFVEYENVEYATRALSDLYGHTLGGLVKGGIRLSYSKNPLGVRSNSVSATASNGPLPSPSDQLSPTSTAFSSMFAGDAFLTPTLSSASNRRLGLDISQSAYQPSYNQRSNGSRSNVASPPPSAGFSPFA